MIKTYSPDLIVHTVLDPANPPSEETLEGIISRLHALVIGPGLGRDDDMQRFGKMCLEVAKKLGKWVVLDAEWVFPFDSSLVNELNPGFWWWHLQWPLDGD